MKLRHCKERPHYCRPRAGQGCPAQGWLPVRRRPWSNGRGGWLACGVDALQDQAGEDGGRAGGTYRCESLVEQRDTEQAGDQRLGQDQGGDGPAASTARPRPNSTYARPVVNSPR